MKWYRQQVFHHKVDRKYLEHVCWRKKRWKRAFKLRKFGATWS